MEIPDEVYYKTLTDAERRDVLERILADDMRHMKIALVVGGMSIVGFLVFLGLLFVK